MTLALELLWLAQRELMLFAAVGILLCGLDDICLDLLYFVHGLRNRQCKRHAPSIDEMPMALRPGAFAIFLPAWDEGNILSDTLRHMLATWATNDFRLFVGVYPNDRPSIDAVLDVAEADARVLPVINGRDGPTTKADCLNALWHAMERDEASHQMRYKGIILHDAEDLVHAGELRLFDRLIEGHDMVQLPVVPLIDPASRWIAGHYADEFADAHIRYLPTRQAIGASVPSAGVGCAFSRDRMSEIAALRGGEPFDPATLTEDYELGLRIRELGGRSAFVRMRDSRGELICTREHFPDTLETALRQKSRWLAGIALCGWDRLGWHGGLVEHWMRLHDRRSLVVAMISATAYGSALLYAVCQLGADWLRQQLPELPDPLIGCLWFTGSMMLWRIAMRVGFTTSQYGWREGLRAIPRSLVANIISILAARRAVSVYRRQMRSGQVVWDKTPHRLSPRSGHGS